jgi:KaiC/GvpD/RAD55 family RecA-like ATPase
MTQPRRDRPPKSKVRQITEPDELLREGLPSNHDAERFILGAVLLDDGRFSEIAGLTPDDFSLERHRRILGAMRDLHVAGEAIDRITVANRLRQRNEGSQDDFSFLIELDTGIPRVPHLGSWLRILREKNVLRRTIVESAKLMQECSLRTAEPAEILVGHLARMEALNVDWAGARGEVRRVEELDSIFADHSPTDYLVKPELPAKAVVCLTGDSESGKTTLACAWGRDVSLRGHAVLILDRDKNPRERVRDRFERLGIQSDSERLRVWDCEQKSEAPQPDDPLVVDWVRRMVAETGKPPVVIVDSLVSFLKGDEDENSAVDMRRVFDRCRVLLKLGATVILIHHTNRQGEARGSSDFRPACDQAFLVSNLDRDGGRLLDIITLKCEKSRYGLFGNIEYHYADGKMVRIEDGPPSKPPNEQLRELILANPGILADSFQKLAQEHGVGRNEARRFLETGERSGTVRVQIEGRKRHHFWRGAEQGENDSAA